MSKNTWKAFIALLRREVVPALGCTEPICLALAAARAAETLGREPERLTAYVSPNLYKNGMGVAVPGTGMTGLEIAAGVGALGGQSALGLEVLRDIAETHVQRAKEMIRRKQLLVGLEETEELIYARVELAAGDDSAVCVIAREHAAIVLVERNGHQLFSAPWPGEAAADRQWPLSITAIHRFATSAPMKMIGFILESAHLNEKVAQAGMDAEWGLKVGRSMQNDILTGLRADDIASLAIKLTAAASDARMAGITQPVMSNSGSGNQGIAATIPVVAFARRLGAGDEELARALIMSHLTAIHLKHYLGRLSALCGAILAASGSACGIVMLLGGGMTEIDHTIRNMIGSIAGMVCDGAKTSCALKVATAVEAGINAALLGMKGISVPGKEGILDDDLETCIRNLGHLGSDGMVQTDKIILDIMTTKSAPPRDSQ